MLGLDELGIIDKITLVNRYVARNKPRYIVIHFIGNQLDARTNAELGIDEYTGLSYHYIIDNKDIVRTAYDIDMTFHINDSTANKVTNYNSISIAICVDKEYSVDNGTVENLISLTNALLVEYSISPDNVLRHYDCSGKNCPSCWRENNWNQWWEFKREIGSIDVSVSVVQLMDMSTQPTRDIDLSSVNSEEFIGIFTPSERLPLYDSPSLSGRILDFYEKNEAIEFDSIFKDEEEGCSWISYISFNGYRRYLLITSDHIDKIKGNIDHSPSPNIDTMDDERAELGIVSVDEEGGMFIPSRSMRVRNKPTTNASHVSTIRRNRPFTYTNILRGNNFVWLSFLNGDMDEWYVPIASYDPITGKEGTVHGKIVRSVK